MKIDVIFNGRTYRAIKRGGQGVVFGDTEQIALQRAVGWDWKHHPRVRENVPRIRGKRITEHKI
jgi:hypothetical protein